MNIMAQKLCAESNENVCNNLRPKCNLSICNSTSIEAHDYIYNSLIMEHRHKIILLLFWNLSGSRVSRYQKGKNQEGKTNLDLLEQEIVSGSGICWTICKSAPHPR